MRDYLNVKLTRKQLQAADDALWNLIQMSAWLHEVSDTMDHTTKRDQAALFRLRAAMLNALDSTA